jgi:site-specific recombinase XerD
MIKLIDASPNDFLIPGENGFMTPNTFLRHYKAFFIEYGLEYKSPHKCRHTFGTEILESGKNIRAVQEMLGHSKVSTTQKYTHVDIEKMRNAVNGFDYGASKKGSNNDPEG